MEKNWLGDKNSVFRTLGANSHFDLTRKFFPTYGNVLAVRDTWQKCLTMPEFCPEQDYERVMTLKKLGAKPFVMPYNKKDKYQKAFARWVNYRPVFESVKWKDYKYYETA